MKFKYLGTYPHLLGDADAVGAEITEWNNIKVSEVQRGKMVCIIIYQPWCRVLNTKFWFDYYALYLGHMGHRSIVGAMHVPLIHSYIVLLN